MIKTPLWATVAFLLIAIPLHVAQAANTPCSGSKGITPGLQQAVNALNTAKIGLEKGSSSEDILKSVKSIASFSGSMRTNLISMLDHVGIHKKLGISSTDLLFSSHSHLGGCPKMV